MMKRPPVVVVVGHVDHGKTSLLDYIRKTSVAAKEAGGITQSVGAYELLHEGSPSMPTLSSIRDEIGAGSGTNPQKITFIDTPGHEAFSKMRARGANIADIAILVVSATDNVQNQTREAIKILKETETPYVVAINKVDKASESNIEAVKQELLKENVLLEGYGGSISWQGVSAKRGDGISELLDLILLTADVEGLEYDPAAPATGYILESKLDNRKGIIANVILKNGTLRVGDYIRAGRAVGKVKTLENFLGEKVKELMPSSPAVIFGFDKLPEVGAEFQTAPEAFEAKEEARTAKKIKEIGKKETLINLMLKADTAGSLEALSQIIHALPRPKEMHLEITEESVGEITDGDIKTAIAHKAAILAFQVKPNKAAISLAQMQNVNIIQSDIIYDLVKAVEEIIKAGTAQKVLGDLEILAIFGKKGGAQIIGGRVAEGEIKNASWLEVERAEKVIGKGKIVNLQSQKRDAKIVPAGAECGLLFDSEIEIKVGDHLIDRA